MRSEKLAVLLLVAAPPLFSLSPALACYEPSAPYCANSYSEFTDQYDFSNCKREMESFQSETDDYLTCNKREANEAVEKAQREAEEAVSQAKSKNDDALSAYNDAVQSFNRRASQ